MTGIFAALWVAFCGMCLVAEVHALCWCSAFYDPEYLRQRKASQR